MRLVRCESCGTNIKTTTAKAEAQIRAHRRSRVHMANVKFAYELNHGLI